MSIRGLVHVWASPDESLDPDEMLCTEAKPFDPENHDPGLAVVFHPWSVIGGPPGYDYSCRWCSTATNRGTTQ